MDSDLKKDLEQTCSGMRINMITAFTIFARTVVRERSIPFKAAADPFSSENKLRCLEKKMENYKANRLKLAEHELTEKKTEISLQPHLTFEISP